MNDFRQGILNSRVWKALSPWRNCSLGWAISSLLAAMVGPFGTYQTFGFLERFVYWGGLIGGALVLAYSIRAVVARAIGVSQDTLRVDIVTSLLQACVLGPLIWLFNYRVLGFDIGSMIWVLEHVGVVLVVCAGIMALRMYLRQTARTDTPLPIATRQPEPDAPFLRRVDAQLGQDLLCVSANDHYLLVVTKVGETRVLMRFRDALEELADIPGYRIHRSHWVARTAVMRVRQDGRRHLVELHCGTELPVSRAYLDALRADGLVA